jgi:RNA polymerase sigma factor (sigma-70 family)
MARPSNSDEPERARTLSTLFARHGNRILGFARNLVRSRRTVEDADDLVQDASAEFLKRPRTYQSESHFLHLFLGFVRNAFHSRGRHRGAQKRGGDVRNQPLPTTGLDLPDPATGPQTAVERTEVRELLLKRLHTLKPDYRQVILLRLQSELEWQEIATRMELPTADAARKKYQYAMQHLERLVPELESEPPAEQAGQADQG